MQLLIDAQPQPAHDRAEVCDTLRIPGVHQGTVDAIADKDESRGIFITLNGISELISKPRDVEMLRYGPDPIRISCQVLRSKTDSKKYSNVCRLLYGLIFICW